MRIALVAPLAEAVPPKFYGGTGRVVSWLAEELVRQGQRITLFASAESETSAELVVCNESVRPGARFNLYNHSILFAATEPPVSINRSGRRRGALELEPFRLISVHGLIRHHLVRSQYIRTTGDLS